MEISWHQKLLLKFSPGLFFKSFAKKIGAGDVFEKAHEAFFKVQRIDFHPLSGQHRGFILVLDLKTALFFYQDGDGFVYDGFEMGAYEKGDVTLFDRIQKNDE